LDNAAVAPISTPAQQAIATWVRQATEEGDTVWPQWAAAIEGIRAEREARFKGWVEPTCEYERVRQELARLEEPERSVMVAFHIAEVPVREIASDIGLPENTVKSHLRRARLKLRRRLGGIE